MFYDSMRITRTGKMEMEMADIIRAMACTEVRFDEAGPIFELSVALFRMVEIPGRDLCHDVLFFSMRAW